MGYVFALISPLFDSVINFLDKFLLSKYNVSPTVLAIYSGLFAFVSGFIVLLVTGVYMTDVKTVIVLMASGFCSVFIIITYFKALSVDEASRVGSLFQFTPVFVLLLSFIFLQETLTLKQYIGCFAIILAGFLFSVRKFDRNLLLINKSLWYMMIACIFSAFVYILFKLGVEEIGFWQAIPYESVGNFVGALCLLFYKNNLKKLQKETKRFSKKVFFYLSISEGIYRISRFSFYYALLLIPASIVSVLQGFQPLFLLIEGIILSVWFPQVMKELINEKTVKVKLLAVMGVFIGLYLLFI